jgi:hypothetical protein
MNGMGTGMGGTQGTCWLVWMSPINMTCFKENYQTDAYVSQVLTCTIAHDIVVTKISLT